MLPGLSLLKVIQRPMLIFFTRLAPVLFVLLSACTTSPSRPPSERSSLDRPSIQVNRAPETKPSVVTVPIETGLEPVPKAPQEPVITQPSPALTQDVDTGRPSDASTSPYATPEESAVAQSALPPMEPVIEPALPTIDYQPPQTLPPSAPCLLGLGINCSRNRLHRQSLHLKVTSKPNSRHVGMEMQQPRLIVHSGFNPKILNSGMCWRKFAFARTSPALQKILPKNPIRWRNPTQNW